MSNTLETEFLVVGGGIAGVSCAELLSTLAPKASITLITPGGEKPNGSFLGVAQRSSAEVPAMEVPPALANLSKSR